MTAESARTWTRKSWWPERKYPSSHIRILNTKHRHSGGGIGDEGGQKLQVKDQDGNSLRIISFRNNMEKKIPLLLIVGKQPHASQLD